MNFYKRLPLKWMALLLLLFPFNHVFAQSTEQPDTSWFTDVTDKVGLANIKAAGGMIWADLNNDEYPDLIITAGLGVDSGWQVFLNEERPGSSDPTDRVFVDETAASNLNIKNVYKDLGGIGDFDNDGNIDIMVNCWPLDNETNCPTIDDPAKEKCRIFWGNGDGTFTLDSIASNTPTGLEQLGNLSGSGLPALDYDHDGNLDVFIACHFDSWCQENATPSHLMHNNGNRTFTETTTAAGINVSQQDPAKPWDSPPAARALFGANVSDWNNDCWADIFTCPYEAVGYPFDATHCLYNYGSFNAYAPCSGDTEDTQGYGNLYMNNGNGTFTDKGVSANWNSHYAWADQGMVPWAAMPADYNNDGNMDYLVLEVHGANNDSASNTVYPNEPGDGRTFILTNEGPKYNYRLRADQNRIVRNKPINDTHGDHTGCWIDMNNDGWQDLLIGDAVYAGSVDNQRIFFEMQDTLTHTFRDITHELGFIGGTSVDSDLTTQINYKIRRPGGLDPVDYDLDGDDDIIKMPYTYPQDSVLILRNNIGNKNNHVTIKLVPSKTSGINRSAIGARITVKAGGKRQMKDIYGDQGQWTNNFPLIQNFGLGQATIIDSIDIRWPDNGCTHTVLTNVPVNQFLRIDENGITSIMPVGANTPNNFTIYPNPTSTGNLNVRFQGPVNPFITIYNELGQQVADYKPGYASHFSLPLGNLPAGLYFIHVIGVPSTSVSTQQFMITAK